jgi:threonine dehydratase
MSHAADDVVLVGEGALREAVRLIHDELGLVVEPSGAAGLAGVIALAPEYRDRLIAVVLTGGNLAAELAATWLS